MLTLSEFTNCVDMVNGDGVNVVNMTSRPYTVHFDENSHAHGMTRSEAFDYLDAWRGFERSQGRAGMSGWVSRLSDDGEWETIDAQSRDEKRRVAA